jgi:Leucine-rich repeat (LRR) protein
MMVFEIILFILLLFDNCQSSEWNCTMKKNSINKNKHFLFSNEQFYEQCTITVEYITRQQEEYVCIGHTLTITSLPPLSLSSNHTMQTFKINSCQLSTLGQLPFSLPSSVEILDLRYNILSTFVLSFPLPSNLKYIYLDNNPNLIDINFGNNRAQQRLIGLSLRHNKKIRLSSLPPHLTQLDLTDCNLLQSSILPLLISLTKLTHLSLADNQLESLPSINENVRLEYFNVSNNRLTLIEDRWLYRQLHTLDLKFNQIRSLEFLKNKLKMTTNMNQIASYDYHDQVSSFILVKY